MNNKNNFKKFETFNDVIKNIKFECISVVGISILVAIALYWTFRIIFGINGDELNDYNIGFISFIGTVFMGFISLFVTWQFHKAEKEYKENLDFIERQPIFIIEIVNNNTDLLYDIENNCNKIIVKNISKNPAIDFSIDQIYYNKLLDSMSSLGPFKIVSDNNDCDDINVISYDYNELDENIMLPKKIEIYYYDSKYDYVCQEFSLNDINVNYYSYDLIDIGVEVYSNL